MADKHKLFVGNLPVDCTQEELQIVFSTYGNPTDIHIMTGKSNSGQSCAFIVYDTYEGAETAIATLDGVYNIREDGSTPLSVKWAKPPGGAAPAGGSYQQARYAPAYSGYSQGSAIGAPVVYAAPVYAAPVRQPYVVQPVVGGIPPPPPPTLPAGHQTAKVFVGNLPQDIQQDAVKMVFGTYGTVTNVHIMSGKSKSGQSCAFVEYTTPLEAETAILTLSEKYEIRPGEGPITVKYATNQQSHSNQAPGRARPY